jgi:hypothetical protein
MAHRLVATVAALAAAAPIPTPIGFGPRYRLDAASPAVGRGAPVGRLACSARPVRRELAHVELFANRRVLLLPAGIGMAPPLDRSGAEVVGARCSYPVRTTRPTGVVEFAAGARLWTTRHPSVTAAAAGHGLGGHGLGGHRPGSKNRSAPLLGTTRHASVTAAAAGHGPDGRGPGRRNRAAPLTVGDLFRVWGQPLGPRRLAGFRGAVSAWVGGRPWRGDPRTIPLRRHAEIVLEVGGYIPPHTFFLFPR